MELVLAIFKKHGVIALVALGLAYLLNEERKASAVDRHDYALVLMQEIIEVQSTVEKVCK
jgi:hypothetical protein